MFSFTIVTNCKKKRQIGVIETNQTEKISSKNHNNAINTGIYVMNRQFLNCKKYILNMTI